jgi:hypothetical protein
MRYSIQCCKNTVKEPKKKSVTEWKIMNVSNIIMKFQTHKPILISSDMLMYTASVRKQ